MLFSSIFSCRYISSSGLVVGSFRVYVNHSPNMLFCFNSELIFAQAASSGASKESNSHKDDGVFKAPAPPPKVIKSVTIPTEPYQDMVTALKCRKEHKEVSGDFQHSLHLSLGEFPNSHHRFI